MSTLGPPADALVEPAGALLVGESDVAEVGELLGSAAADVVESVALELEEGSVVPAEKATAGEAPSTINARDKSPPAHTDHQ
jgi:hypothetical protein